MKNQIACFDDVDDCGANVVDCGVLARGVEPIRLFPVPLLVDGGARVDLLDERLQREVKCDDCGGAYERMSELADPGERADGGGRPDRRRRVEAAEMLAPCRRITPPARKPTPVTMLARMRVSLSEPTTGP